MTCPPDTPTTPTTARHPAPGRVSLQLVIDHVRARQVFSVLTLSYVPGPGCPAPFYSALGFVPTGRLLGQEVELALALAGPPAAAHPQGQAHV